MIKKVLRDGVGEPEDGEYEEFEGVDEHVIL
jgi:hypothetical protein